MIQNKRLCDMFAEQLKKKLADNLKKIILFGFVSSDSFSNMNNS